MPLGKPFNSSYYHRVQQFIVYECCCTDPKTLYKHYCLLCIYYSTYCTCCHYILAKLLKYILEWVTGLEPAWNGFAIRGLTIQRHTHVDIIVD